MEYKNNTQLVQTQHDTKDLQMASLNSIKEWYNDFVRFSKEILKKDLDYGVIPGVAKPSLLKPGAEKLRFVYGLGVEMTLVSSKEDLDRGYLDYTYKATVRSRNGQIIAECEGNANSYESKWRYNWVVSDKKPSKDEAETLKAQKLGRWAKSGNDWVWMEKQENKDIVGLKNTLMKMAQKRAFVGAILIATGASEFFTQDVEDMDIYPTQDEVVTGNKYADVLSKLVSSKVITNEQYQDVINDEEKSRQLIQDIKNSREAKNG